MRSVRLIRHGESAANAGAATRDHASISLTDKGIEQGRQVALSFLAAPELIVTSPYSRAQATAAWTASAYPAVRLEIWKIQEFTYLELARCVDTRVAQRRLWVEDYWGRADPDYVDGEGAESFADFIGRAQAFLETLSQRDAQNIVVFSHGQLINAVAWLIKRKPSKIDGQSMKDWREFEITNHVANCAGYILIDEVSDGCWRLSRSTGSDVDLQ